MTTLLGGYHVIVCDHQDYWRNFAADALRAAGFNVQTLAHYDDDKVLELSNVNTGDSDRDSDGIDLVVLGCASIRKEEVDWIKYLIALKLNVIVVCNSLSRQTSRSLFLLGLEDVTDKPYDADVLVRLVKTTIEQIGSRDGYRLATKGDWI